MEHARAAEQEQAAAKTTAQETERETAAMNMATMSKKELIKEIQRLRAARNAAADARDVETWRSLTQQMAAANNQLRELSKAKKLNQLAMLGQAQTAASLAGQLKSLAAQAQSGSTDFASMGMQVVSLGMAFKALSGPIGWAMLALQAAQMAFDKWMADKKEKQAADLEQMKQLAEHLEKQRELYNEMYGLRRNMELDRLKKDLEAAFKAAADTEEQAVNKAREHAAEEQRAAAEQRQAADAALEQEKARIEAAKQRGQITEEQAVQQQRAAEDAHRRALDHIEEEAEASKQRLAAAAEDAATTAAKAMGSALAKLKPIAAFKMPTADEYKELEHRLELLDEDEGEAVARAEMDAINKKFAKVRQMLADAGIAFEGGNHELIDFVADLRSMVQEGKTTLEAKQKERKAAAAAAEAEQGNAELAEKKRALDAETTAATRDAADATREHAAAEKQKAEAAKEAAELQRKTLENLRDVLEDTKTTRTYTAEDKRTETQILRADRDLLAERKKQLTELRRTPGLDAATLKQIDAALKEVENQGKGLADALQRSGNAAKSWLQELQPPKLQARARHAQHALDNLAKQFDRQAKQAAKAAAAGDAKGLERAYRNMDRTAKAMANVSKDAGKVGALYRETVAKVDAVAEGTKVTAKEAKDTAKAGGKLTRETDKAANAMAKVAADAKGQKTPGKVAEAAAAARSMQQQTAAVQAEMAKFTQEQGQLVAAVGRVATAAEQGASATAAALRSVNARLNNLTRQIDAIRRNMK